MQRISIVTPSLNQAAYLEQCIDSVLSQNYSNLEYIIMDGGSTDGSVEIIKKYEKFLSYWQTRPDGGHYKAVNEGFGHASGDVMGWLNSDDMLHQGGLQVLDETFSLLPHVEFLTSLRIGFDGDGNLLTFNDFNQTWCHELLLQKELIENSVFIMQEGTYWRRGLWERAGASLDLGYELAGDFELWVRLSRYAALHSVDALTGGFRYHSEDQRCNRHRDKYVQECYDVIDRELRLRIPAKPHMVTLPEVIHYPIHAQGQSTPAAPPVTAPTVISRRAPAKISIVTPSYNQAEFLEECIDSILSQGYPNLEYIIMDGGSTDGSADIIKKYEKHLSYWQSKPDGGQYNAINDGFRRCTGEIMAWLNSDDMYHPGALHLVDLAFQARPETKWITGRPTLWDRLGHLDSLLGKVPEWSRQRLLTHTPDDLCIQQESTFWRRSLWDQAGAYVSRQWQLAGDFELWCRFSRHAQLVGLDALLGGFRCHGDQKTASSMGLYEKEVEQIIAEERAAMREAAPNKAVAPTVTVEDIAKATRPLLSREAFSYFSYARKGHFSWLTASAHALLGHDIDPQRCDIHTYQELLCHAVITHNIPAGAHILEIGSGGSRLAKLLQSQYRWSTIDGWAEPPGHGSREGRIGTFSPRLQPHSQDFIFSLATPGGSPCSEEDLRSICSDISRLLKPGALTLHCFEIGMLDGIPFMHPMAPYMFRACQEKGLPPFDLLRQDPFALALSARAGDRFWLEESDSTRQHPCRFFSAHSFWSRPLSIDEALPPPGPEAAPAALRPGSGGERSGKSPLVSVIVSSDSGEEHLGESLQGLIDQTITKELEIIVVACGNGNEGQLISRCGHHNARELPVSQGSTAGAALNAALETASGRYVVVLKSTDRLKSDACEQLAAALEHDPTAMLAYGDTCFTAIPHETFANHTSYGKVIWPDYTPQQLTRLSEVAPHPLWRRELHDSVGFLPEGYPNHGMREFLLQVVERFRILHLQEFTGLKLIAGTAQQAQPPQPAAAPLGQQPVAASQP